MITKINMVIMMVKDLDAAVALYESLGLRIVFRVKNEWAELDAGGTRVGLCPTSIDMGPVRTGIVFEVDDVQSFYAQHQGRITFEQEPIIRPHGIIATMQDASGNIIDLYQPTPERLAEFVKKQTEDARLKSEQGCCKKQENLDECCNA